MSAVRSGRKYRKPPVIEALCELYFAGSEWDDTVPGRFFELVKEDFPVKRQREIQEAQITFAGSESAAKVKRLHPWIQFVSEKGDRMVQLARDLLVINQLTPYPSFEDWEPSIGRCLDIYRKLARPKSVARLGVRYINRVVIPEAKLKMETYFTVYPELPKGMGDEHGAFMVRFEIPSAQGGHSVVVTFASSPAKEGEGQAFLLDLYDIWQSSSGRDLEEVPDLARQAHRNVESAFEGSIRDPLRELFQPEDDQ